MALPQLEHSATIVSNLRSTSQKAYKERQRYTYAESEYHRNRLQLYSILILCTPLAVNDGYNHLRTGSRPHLNQGNC